MKNTLIKTITALIVVIVLAASFYVTYYYSYNEGRRTGFNDGLTEGQVWTLQPVQSGTIVFPNSSTYYPLLQEAFLLLGDSNGLYNGVVHYGFEIWQVNATTGNVSSAKYTNDIFMVSFECGSYVVSTGWIKASENSVQGSLEFSVPVNDTLHYSANVLVTAGQNNESILYLFNTVSLSIAQ